MPDTQETVRQIAHTHFDTPGGLLPALHAVQDTLGHVPDEAVPVLAEGFHLSRAEVHGVLTYYHHFRRQPPGRHVVQVCQAEACQACGAGELMAHLQQRLGIAGHGTRADGAVTLEPVYCLGLCASSPAVMIDQRPHAHATPQRMDRLLDGLGVNP